MTKHDWAVTDTQGHCMECVNCGMEIVHPVMCGDDSGNWDEIDGECAGKKEDG
jgi:hypothetical protein